MNYIIKFNYVIKIFMIFNDYFDLNKKSALIKKISAENIVFT